MRILQINKFFHVRGGADTFFFKTCDLLASRGHEVAHFSTRHPKNQPSAYERYFVDGYTEDDAGQMSAARKVSAFVDGIYNFGAVRKIEALVRDFRPDVAHVHNFNYQLSPSIFETLREAGVPTILTLHDYTWVCGAGTLYRDGKICELCRGGRHFNLLRHGCFHGGAASAMATLSQYAHEIRKPAAEPTGFVSPSRFLRAKLADFGVAEERIAHLPNFVDFAIDLRAPVMPGSYVLYFGRFAETKGVRTLLDASEGLNVRVVFVGDGPLRAELENRARARPAQLEVRPFTTSRQELQAMVEESAVVIVPSIWYENQPTTVLEAYSLGKPVIASRIGGIPELVEEGNTGLLFEAGNAADLRGKIEFLLASPDLRVALGKAGKKKVATEFSRDAHYEGLMRIYAAVAPGRAARFATAI